MTILPYLMTKWSPEHNCWWLVRDFYSTNLGIDLPAYPWEDDIHRRYDMIDSASRKSSWKELEEPEEFCVTVSGIPSNHCGVYLRDKCQKPDKLILHLEQNSNGRLHPLSYFTNLKFYSYVGKSH